jgi:iron complex transport system substrate-binding protein
MFFPRAWTNRGGLGLNMRARSRNRFLHILLLSSWLLLVLALLGACGADSNAAKGGMADDGHAPQTTPAAPAQQMEPTAVVAESFFQVAPRLPAVVKGANGQTVTVESIERMVSLNGDITEIIFALGLGEHIVGIDSSATYPPDRVDDIASIGYQRRLNAEGILSLNPTLVIGNDHAGPPEVLDQVRAAGVPVAIAASSPTLESAAHKITFVARTLGVPERGTTLLKRLGADMAAAQALLEQATEPPPRVLFLYLRGSDVQLVAGSATAADAMITAAGGINIGAEVGLTDFEPISPETLVAAEPAVLLVPENGLESVGGLDDLLTMQGLANTPAAQERRVIAMDDLYLLGMGPRTGQALHDLIIALYPSVQSVQEEIHP